MKPLPRLPAAKLLGHTGEFRSDRLRLLERVYAECGDIGSLRFGPLRVVVVSDAALAREVLLERPDDFVRFQAFGAPATKRLLGHGLLMSDGGHHRAQRRRMAPAFQHRHVVTHFSRAVCEETELWQRTLDDGSVVDVAREMSQLALAISGRTLLGVDLRADDPLGSAITDAIGCVLEEVTSLVHLPLGWPTSRNRRFRHALGVLDDAIVGLICARRGNADDAADVADVLSMLLDGSMPDDAVLDEMRNLLLAGYEAMSATLAWSLDLLSRNPGIRAALRARADGEQSPFALQIYKETLRLYPPGHIIVRQTARDVELGGYAIPAGRAVFVNGWVIHRRADYFERPAEFDPDRFDPARDGAHRGAYFPFGVGPRTCIGNHLAMLEGQLVLATLAPRIELDLMDDAPTSARGSFAVVPGPLRMRVRRLATARSLPVPLDDRTHASAPPPA